MHNQNNIPAANALPPCATHLGVNLTGIFMFFAAMFWLPRQCPGISSLFLTIICLSLTMLPLGLYEFFIARAHHRASAGLNPQPGPVDRRRLVTKLIGLYGTFIIVILIYHLAPMYHSSAKNTAFYQIFFDFLCLLAPAIIIGCLLYFRAIDRRQKDPYDSYWHMGCLLTGRFKEVAPEMIKEHARAWFIKAFFVVFMFAFLVTAVENMLAFPWQSSTKSFLPTFNALLDALYAVDLIYGVLGYLLTVRFFDTHIRSAEPTLLGWLVCLVCYDPFASIIGINIFNFDDGLNWDHWLGSSPTLFYIWAALIFFCTFIYALATVAFGWRMSNLTYRGIITNGPYRYTKHPAYLGKVVSWWLMAMPFLSAGNPLMALKHTLYLGIITYIYYLRARTEENHLSNYPEYVQYASWINENGLFSFITKRVPALRYSEERCRRSNSVVWFKKLK